MLASGTHSQAPARPEEEGCGHCPMPQELPHTRQAGLSRCCGFPVGGSEVPRPAGGDRGPNRAPACCLCPGSVLQSALGLHLIIPSASPGTVFRPGLGPYWGTRWCGGAWRNQTELSLGQGRRGRSCSESQPELRNLVRDKSRLRTVCTAGSGSPADQSSPLLTCWCQSRGVGKDPPALLASGVRLPWQPPRSSPKVSAVANVAWL